MAVLSREDLLARVQAIIGEETSDEALTLLEDVTDTYSELESKVTGDSEDWKAKYEENDSTWRKKYKERFMSGSETSATETGEQALTEQKENVEADGEPRTFEDLFEEREG